MTKLNIDYVSFDDYMKNALNCATRTKLRKKFRAAAQAMPIEMSVVGDVTPIIDNIYPLYLQVYERSKLHFEKLTKEYFCKLRAHDAREGSVFHQAAERKGRRFHPLHDQT